MKGKLIWGITGLVLCLALVLGTAIPRSTPPAEADGTPGTVTIGINPSTYNAVLNETFTLDIRVTITGSENVTGVEAHLNFDATKLEVKSITKGAAIGAWTEFSRSWNNTAGTIDYSLAALGVGIPATNQTFVMATIEFKALAVTNSTALTFVTTPGVRETIVSYEGFSILDGVQPGAVTIIVCTLLGQVSLQGRSATSGPTWETPLTVTLLEQGTTTPLTYNVTTDNQGNFEVSGMLPGTYNVTVKCAHTLANRKNGLVISGATTGPIAFGTLREGDANNDNIVNINDVTPLATSFGKLSGQPEFIDNCDFNRDSLVNINDVTLMAMNFGTSGDIIVP